MIQLQGDWFDGKTSAHQQVVLSVDDGGLVRIKTLADGQLLLQVDFAALRISSRIGSTPRYIYFPTGEKLETLEHGLVDSVLHAHRPSVFNTLAHKLESHLQFVVLTVVLVIGLSWWAVQYGLPAAAKVVANQLPLSVMNLASTQTMELLDKLHFSPSELDEKRQRQLLEKFAPAIQENADLHIQVVFRAGGDIGANAFALPNGTIVFTDEIVQLAKDDNELLAVLAHEIGHVQYRHGLRSAIQGSVIGFAVSMLTGDLSAAGNLLAGLPVILTTMSYSRDFEREADDNALSFLTEHQIPKHHFIDLMERLTLDARCNSLLASEDRKIKKAAASVSSEVASSEANKDSESVAETAEAPDLIETTSEEQAATSIAAEESAEQQAANAAARQARCEKLMAEVHDSSSSVMTYFSSHPETAERLAKFRD